MRSRAHENSCDEAIDPYVQQEVALLSLVPFLLFFDFFVIGRRGWQAVFDLFFFFVMNEARKCSAAAAILHPSSIFYLLSLYLLLLPSPLLSLPFLFF